MNDPIETEVVPSQALAVRSEAGAVGAALPASDIKPPITAAQAKVEAVAALTMSAYEKAATLQLTPEETKALQADFPDDAFQPGAGGKEHLIYVEHAALRQRFNEVFGLGQWAIIPRNRWAEPFKTQKGDEGSRVYVEAMLVVRGCFVGEAVGAMEYYPHNASQNYGDAVEGAKTAAFRRCAKEFGVGLQAWKKEFGEEWWARKRASHRPPPSTPTPPAKTPPAPSTGPSSAVPKPESAKIPFPTPESRAKMIAALMAGPTQANRKMVTEFFKKLTNPTPLMPMEELEELDLRFVPATMKQMEALAVAVEAFGAGQDACWPYKPHDEPAAAKPEKTAPPAKAKDHTGMERVTGKIEHVSRKDGTSKKGPWTCYGIKIGEVWFNTFSGSMGKTAEEQKGSLVTLWFTSTDKGNTAEDIEIGEVVP